MHERTDTVLKAEVVSELRCREIDAVILRFEGDNINNRRAICVGENFSQKIVAKFFNSCPTVLKVGNSVVVKLQDKHGKFNAEILRMEDSRSMVQLFEDYGLKKFKCEILNASGNYLQVSHGEEDYFIFDESRSNTRYESGKFVEFYQLPWKIKRNVEDFCSIDVPSVYITNMITEIKVAISADPPIIQVLKKIIKEKF